MRIRSRRLWGWSGYGRLDKYCVSVGNVACVNKTRAHAQRAYTRKLACGMLGVERVPRARAKLMIPKLCCHNSVCEKFSPVSAVR